MDQEAATAAVEAQRPLKTEPINEEEEELDEEDEHEMEGIQSAGPSSPQPMCTNADEHQNNMPPPALHPLPPPPSEIKTELPWCNTELAKAELPGPSPAAPSASTGSTPSSVPRPTFGDAFTGHTPLASPLTSRHPIRLPLAAASGKYFSLFIYRSVLY